ncbi:MAG TPA: outer membrane protein [Mesorhizobium sp.]|nr:outer membrane protein [Mesorhizobium sp.]
MKKLLIAAALLAGASSTALAADAIVDIPEAPIAIVDTFTWTGFYVGLHAGYGFGDTETEYYIGDDAFGNTAGFEPNQDYDIDGFLGGVQVGYNHQINNLVLGVEADFSFSNIEGESGDIFTTPGQEGGFYTTDVDWFGTVRGRLGFAVDRTLFYGTGGFAYGQVENSVVDFFEPGAVSEDDVSTGWTAGGGVEHAFTDNVTVKVEYLYIDLGDQTISDGGRRSVEFENQFHTVKLGFNYKF